MRPIALLPLLAACKVEEAPPSLNAAYDGFWNDFAAEDEALQEHLLDLIAVVDVEALRSGPVRGVHDPLAPDDIDDLTFRGPRPDPSLATPMYIQELLPCTMEAYERIVAYPDQNELYGKYEAYERRYDDEPARFLDGTLDHLGWEGTIETSIFDLYVYVYHFRTEARRVPLPEEAGLPGSTFLVVKNWMLEPATFTKGGKSSSFPQDYQLEIFWPVGEGELAHAYPSWREMRIGGLDMENDFVRGINFDQMIGWGKITGTLCEEGRP